MMEKPHGEVDVSTQEATVLLYGMIVSPFTHRVSDRGNFFATCRRILLYPSRREAPLQQLSDQELFCRA